VVERREEGHALLVQRPVYFISECREASGRIAKWAVEIMGETISFAPRKAIKSQVLVDFVAEWVNTQLPAAPIQPELWTMFFDGSLMKTGAGAGLLFISPLGKHLRYVLRLHFPASNNMAEYEALVNGLHIAIELGVRRLNARGDSQLVINQVIKNSHCRDPKLEAYCDEVRHLEDKFYGLKLNHIARRYNETADELAKIASGQTTVPPRCLLPRSTSTLHQERPTRPSPRRPRPSLRRPRPSPRHPQPPRVRHCASRKSGTGSCLIETGKPRTCNISIEESYPLTEPRLGDWRGAPSRSSCWVTRRISTTVAPQASFSDAYPSPKVRSYCKKYTRGLAVITQHLEPSLETPSDKVSTGQPRWPTPLGLYAPAKGVNSTQGRHTCPLRPCKQYPSPGRSLCGVWTSSVPCRRHPGASRTCWSLLTNSPSGLRSDP
jgi:ribonuclease HI